MIASDKLGKEKSGMAPVLVSLEDMQFRFPLRKYQQEILELVKIKLGRGERELHIVAPPGAGKTIIGLQIISELKLNSLVVSPNTTIQSQWGDKTHLFLPDELQALGSQELLGTHEDKPLKPITLLTYQVLSTPGREQEYLEKLAHQGWVTEMSKSLGLSTGQAELRVLELLQNNPKAHQKEMSRHSSRLRLKLAELMDLNEVLHANALDLLQALRRQKFGLVIFDECHHLTDYWAAVMRHLINYLDDAVVIGLTGTPPEGKSNAQENRYLSLVGEIDFQVPTPALVKEGGLAPFQDLVYFTEPTESEMGFLEVQHEDFHLLLQEMVQPQDGGLPSNLSLWVLQRLKCYDQLEGIESPILQKFAKHKNKEKKERVLLPKTPAGSKETNQADDTEPELTTELHLAMCRYLWQQKLRLPAQVELGAAIRQSPFIDDWMMILEDYSLHYLKTSPDQQNHDLLEKAKSAIRKLGYALTEKGIRKQASPVDRVLAFSQSKSQAVAKILELEYRNLSDGLRACVVTDFERMSATEVRSLKGVLDQESGGALCAFKHLLQTEIAYYLNPCLVTGSMLLVDSRVVEHFVESAQKYLQELGHKFELDIIEHANGFCEVTAQSGAWETRLYVGMATAMFELGITKCLIGTRGIFGEGWDSQALNTLIDLTTMTSPVSVKQLRGRSIRINTKDPLGARKVANNWDVVCIAPQLEKGLNDYGRFVRKHEGFFGIADDGQIECGVGHVHPSFSELTPADIFASSSQFNSEMLERALAREKIYELWKVGESYGDRLVGCVEISNLRKIALTPPFIRYDLNYKEHASQMRASLNGVWFEHAALGTIGSAFCGYMLLNFGMFAFAAFLPLVLSLVLAHKKHEWLFNKLQNNVCQIQGAEASLRAMAQALLSSLQETKFIPQRVTKDSLYISLRSNGSYRVFLDDVEAEQSEYFAKCFQELMAPISNQPFLIPKYEFPQPKTKESEESEVEFFKSYLKEQAKPKIGSYHAVPKLLARSEKGREIFEASWNKYVSPGFIINTKDKPELLDRYFGVGPSLSKRLLWE